MIAKSETLPFVDTERRSPRVRVERVASALFPTLEQLALFPPSIMRRRTMRVRRAIAFFSLGKRHVHYEVDRIELETTSAATDHGQAWRRRGTYGRLDSRYVDDFTARMFVRDHPEGASHSEVAEALGLSKSRAHEIEQAAFKKLLARAKTDPDVRSWMFALAEHLQSKAAADHLGIDIEA